MKKEFIEMTGHNTFIIKNKDPMPTVLNFGYLNWVKCRVLHFSETEIVCQHDGIRKSL